MFYLCIFSNIMDSFASVVDIGQLAPPKAADHFS